MKRGEVVTKEKKEKCPCCRQTLVVINGRCVYCERIIVRKVAA
jgi:hypothetical protein